MLNNKTVAVVVPAYNEITQIRLVIESMPAFVDRIIIVNDCSKDKTADLVAEIIAAQPLSGITLPNTLDSPHETTRYNRADLEVLRMQKEEIVLFNPHEVFNKNPDNERVILINHTKNGGVGAAISTGYKWCKDHNIDCTAVMAGDGQMDPGELESICRPVVDEEVDYVKGNRLIHRSAWVLIPKVRYFGNSILSILTKMASGYWHVSDTQTGYTAISLSAMKAVALHKIYRSYGMPNDLLVKLNIAFCTLREVEIKPIYQVGEQSKMKIFKVIPRVSMLLVVSFFKRLWIKYLFRDFHPLFLLYNFSFLLMIFVVIYGVKILSYVVSGLDVNPVTLLAFALLFISSFQALLFAMWMDIQDNERLYK